jgi:nitroreductase
MDILTAIKERRSCRAFLPDPVGGETVDRIIEAAVQAPSPANNQPWEFIVITSPEIKEKLAEESETCKKMLCAKSGWKWLDRYSVAFLKEAPVIIAVVGDPAKTGADMFLEGGGICYQHACAAAIQNMLLTACALGLGTLWFTLFDKDTLRTTLNIAPAKDPLALICLGKQAREPMQTPRTAISEKTRYIP